MEVLRTNQTVMVEIKDQEQYNGKWRMPLSGSLIDWE